MKKLFLLAMAFVSLTAFAQTNLFQGIDSIGKWSDSGNLGVVLNADNSVTVTIDQTYGYQWGNQVFVYHHTTFDAAKYYAISMTITASAASNASTIKIDDNTEMLLVNGSQALTVGPNNLNWTVQGKAGSNGKMVFAFPYVPVESTLTISNISIVETAAPVFDGCGETFKATSGNAALGHDGKADTRWESGQTNAQNWQWNMTEAQTFNRVKIVWEGAYGKSFNILAGNSCDNLHVIASVSNQTLSVFPYTQIIELDSSVTASSVQFEGIARGTDYGYSFWEFDVYKASTSVLSGLEFTASAAIAKVGEGSVALTATPKDQYNAAMEAEVTYAVSPAAAGHVTDGVYYADAAGTATITATAGTFSKQVSIFNYTGTNVALNKTATANGGYNEVARVNDGNDGTEFQADPDNGTDNHDVTCGFTIDLGAAYDLSLVTIHFEGACSDAYTLETSTDNSVWATAHSFSGTLGINNHTDYLYGENLANATGVRYLKFTSTKNATNWGMKIFEFMAYGTAASSPATSLDNADASLEVVKFIENGRLVIIKNGIRYNAQGICL